MEINETAYRMIIGELQMNSVTLVAVSKTKTISAIKKLYDLGQKDFGENYVQELADKYAQLPPDIRWHFIGHLQTNKVKQLAAFVQLIHAVDSLKLLNEINKEGKKNGRVIECLLQVHLSKEETKFGLDEKELEEIISDFKKSAFENVKISGLMGMASFTNDMKIVGGEFRYLKSLFDKFSQQQTVNYKLQILSMGMSSDYKIAIEEGSNMVRIGSLIFGERKKKG